MKPRASRYVLLTAAYNEESRLSKTISSVISQTYLPEKWVIVSDGSTDRTDAITLQYVKEYPFVELLHREKGSSHDFASKVYALAAGFQLLRNVSFEFIGHLDADVSFGPTYFADLLMRLECDPSLGVAGGDIYEWDGRNYSPRKGNSVRSVAGAVQMFRHQCYDSIGGFLPLEHGGEDWCAEVTARMKGWRVRSFPELVVYHHHGSKGWVGRMRRRYREGMMDFCLGSHPLFEIAKLARRLQGRPLIVGACVRLCAYVFAACYRERRIVSEEFVRFLRQEQMERLRAFTRRR